MYTRKYLALAVGLLQLITGAVFDRFKSADRIHGYATAYSQLAQKWHHGPAQSLPGICREFFLMLLHFLRLFLQRTEFHGLPLPTS
ncbi:hypothetical protein V8C34DRAFT_294417 [Trichoderma compactum]